MTDDDVETIETSLGVTLPSEYVHAATAGAGNYFCLYTTKIDEGVFLRDHEIHEITKEYDSFDEFLLKWSGVAQGNATREKGLIRRKSAPGFFEV